MSSGAIRVVLVGGHESRDGVELARFEDRLSRLAGLDAVAVRAGRPLQDAVQGALRGGCDAVVVVPMTYGRDPGMIADAAKTLRWLSTQHAGAGAVALAEPFGTPDHLVARLRAVAGAVRAGDPQAALVIGARAANPFDDAELHRIAHLVRVHGAGVEVQAAALERDSAISDVLERLRLLGFPRAVVAPAGFADRLDLGGVSPSVVSGLVHHGPLMSDAAVARVVIARVETALHGIAHGRDGIDAGLGADHGHGYAHSHDDHTHDGADSHGGHSHSAHSHNAA